MASLRMSQPATCERSGRALGCSRKPKLTSGYGMCYASGAYYRASYISAKCYIRKAEWKQQTGQMRQRRQQELEENPLALASTCLENIYQDIAIGLEAIASSMLEAIACRLEAMSSRLEAGAKLGWRPSLLGWRPSLLGFLLNTYQNTFQNPHTSCRICRAGSRQSTENCLVADMYRATRYSLRP